jgi:hypothetical protein
MYSEQGKGISTVSTIPLSRSSLEVLSGRVSINFMIRSF